MINKYCLFLMLLFSQICLGDTNIVVVGDFGGGDDKPIADGKSGQKIVADAMENYCKTVKNSNSECRFIIGTGDNFYPSGVEDKYIKNIAEFFDKRFMKFYRYFYINNIPFFMSLGNHDIGDLGWGSTLQKLYTRQIDRLRHSAGLMFNQISIHKNKEINQKIILSTDLFKNTTLPFFYLPSSFYSLNLNKGINLFAVDTMSFPAQHFNENALQNLKGQKQIITFKVDESTDVSSDDDNTPKFEPALATPKEVLQQIPDPNNEEQLEQLKKAMAADARWKIVFGHFPILSHGKHGKEFLSVAQSGPMAKLRKTLCEQKVDFYFTGHDHHLEFSTYRCNNNHTIAVVLSGAGAKLDRIMWNTLYRPSRIFGIHEDAYGKEAYFHWGNGRYFEKYGDDTKFAKEKAARVLGFSTVQLDKDGKEAIIRMHVPYAQAMTSGKYADLDAQAPERKTACIKFIKQPHLDVQRCDENEPRSILYTK